MLLQARNNKKNTALFKKIFDDYFQTIVLFVTRFVNNNQEIAQDITQESFIELWNSKIELTDSIQFKSFLYVTSKNKALNIVKHEQVREKYFLKNNDLESERYFQNHLIEEETILLVKKAIDLLPENSRKVILLKLDGYKQEDIANEMNVSVDTVKYYRKVAFRILREKLKDVVCSIL